MMKSSTVFGQGTAHSIKQTLNPKCLSQDFPPTIYIAQRDKITISRVSSQLSSRQSGLACSTSQVGRSAKAAIQKTQCAPREGAGPGEGRVIQRINIR